MRVAGEFARWWPAHKLHYAVPVAVHDNLAQGRNVQAHLSHSVLLRVQAVFPAFSVMLFSATPDLLVNRLARALRPDGGRGRP